MQFYKYILALHINYLYTFYWIIPLDKVRDDKNQNLSVFSIRWTFPINSDPRERNSFNITRNITNTKISSKCLLSKINAIAPSHLVYLSVSSLSLVPFAAFPLSFSLLSSSFSMRERIYYFSRWHYTTIVFEKRQRARVKVERLPQIVCVADGR